MRDRQGSGDDRGLYAGPDRRSEPDISLHELEEIIDRHVIKRISEHEIREKSMLDEKFADLKSVFVSALPGGSIDEARTLLESLRNDRQSIRELVTILAGMKFLRSFAVVMASLVGAMWIGVLWLKDHFKW